MNTRPDPLCVCAHRSSFSGSRSRVNQSRPSTLMKTNLVVSSENERDLRQIVPLQDTVSHIAGPIVSGSISTISPSAEGSSRAIISPDVYILSKRSRSCNGRVETPATITRYIQGSGARRTRGANISWANDLREWDIDGRTSDWKSHKTPDLPQSGPDDGQSVGKHDFEPSRKTLEVKIYRTQDQSTQDQSTQTEPIEALLVVPPKIQLTDQPCFSTSSSPTLIATTSMQGEEDPFLESRSKRRRQETEDVSPVLYRGYVVGNADGSSHHAPPIFDPDKYLGLDFYFAYPQYNSPTGVDASKSKDRSDRQVNTRPGLKKFSASAPNSVGRSEDLSQLPISASPFVSALDKFNEIVPNCDSEKPLPNIDAMKRFQDAPAWCLANTAKGSRCTNRIAAEKQQEIKQLLTQLAEKNIENTPPSRIVEFTELVTKAVCHQQRPKVLEKLKPVAPHEPAKDGVRPFASLVSETDAVIIKVEEVPSSPYMSNKGRTCGGQDAQAIDTPVVNSAGKITTWCRTPPKEALIYLPDYRTYQLAPSKKSSVVDWVMKQAATPLTKSEREEGYLYVYWNQATFGVRKIGYTTMDVSERLKRWESQCKHIAEEQYRSPSIVRNAKRLERLVHAHLKEYRVKEHGCRGCGKCHDEWFDGVDFDIIRESIDFWTEWIMEGQYENRNGKWFLKKDAKKKLQQVFKLCDRISVANARESEEKLITKSPPRYNLRRRSATRSPSHRS